jgi:hypothetical protein
VLYRARVHAARVEALHVFGDASRIARAFGSRDLGPETLGMILGGAETHAAINALAEDSTRREDIALKASDGATCWVRNAVRVTGRSGDAVDVVGYLSEVTQEKEQQLRR